LVYDKKSLNLTDSKNVLKCYKYAKMGVLLKLVVLDRNYPRKRTRGNSKVFGEE
jgi:hypothetical protein